MSNYDAYVKGKCAEEILSNADCSYDGPIGEYLRISAQVRSNQELAASLSQASHDSGRLQARLLVLTVVVAGAGIAQAAATAWPWFTYWLRH